jgi:hypothetical protein
VSIKQHYGNTGLIPYITNAFYFLGVHDRMQELLVRNTCETALLATLHPRTSVLVIVQEMQDSGGVSEIFYPT